MIEGFIIGVLLASVVVFLSNRYGWLTLPAAAGAFVLGVLVFGFCGIQWSVPLLVFFFSSVLLTRYGRERKQRVKQISDTEPRRRLHQVLANGLVAGMMILISVFFPHEQWYIIYGAVIASVTSDTWSTEVGILSSRGPRSIRDGRKVAAGSSGGLTLWGIGAGIAGSTCIFMSMIPWLGFDFRSFCIICFSGFLANLSDSLLGATLQVRYRCPRCQGITERLHHCDNTRTEYYKGIRILTNDGVNFLASICGALSAFILVMVFR